MQPAPAPIKRLESTESRVKVPTDELNETPTREDLPKKRALPEVASTPPPPSFVPDASLRAVTVATGAGSTPPESGVLDSSRPPSSRRLPPPLPPPMPESVPRAAPVPVFDLTNLPPQRVPTGARYSRWIALAIGAGLATFWLSSRARHQAESVDPPVAAVTNPEEPPAAPTEPSSALAATAEPAAAPAASDSIAPLPSAAREGTLDSVLEAALARAKSCARPGSAPSVNEVTVTFAPSGKVTSAQVEGESLADEGLRSCVLGHLRSLVIPAFQGNEMRVRRELDLKP